MALPDGRILLSIGDVAGHGLEASVAMSSLRGAIRSAARDDARPSAILTRVNAFLLREHRGLHATALVAILEPLSLDVTLASAGHAAPAIADPCGEIMHPAVAGGALGADVNARYDDVDLRLEPGSSMLFYTNGLTKGRGAGTALARLDAALLGAIPAGDDLAGCVYRMLLGDEGPLDDVAVLAGGLRDWTAAGLPLTTDVPRYPRAAFTARERPALRATREDVIAVAEGRSGAQFLETQRDGTYAQRDRDIPNNVRLSASDLLEDARGGRIADRAKLDELVAKAGLDKHKRTIVSCGSGVGASGAYLALCEAGFTNVAVYDGSWMEWSHDDLPTVPKTAPKST